MKKIIPFLLIIFLLGFTSPVQAAWYDWFSWSKIKSVFTKETQKQDNQETIDEPKDKIQPEPELKPIAPIESKTIPSFQDADSDVKSLRAEVSVLKISLDNLYKAHNELVTAYSALSKSSFQSNLEQVDPTKLAELFSQMDRKITALQDKVYSNQSDTQTDTITLNRVIKLESKLEEVCGWIFGGLSFGCPSTRFGSGNLEDRIKKLEVGY